MARKRGVAKEQAPRAAVQRKPGIWPALLCSVLACAISAAATFALARQPQPLGVSVPPPPAPHFTIADGQDKDLSVRRGRMNLGWMTLLAPQPDGVPPLTYEYTSDKLLFKLSYPFGAEIVQFAFEDFMKDGVDSQAQVRFEQPLAAVKISLLPKERKVTQLKFADKLVEDLKAEGVKVLDKPHAVELPAGTLVSAAYEREGDAGKLVHRLFLAGVQQRVMVFDFTLRPDERELGEKYAIKIMNSFDPGSALAQIMEQRAKAKSSATANDETSSSGRKQPANR